MTEQILGVAYALTIFSAASVWIMRHEGREMMTGSATGDQILKVGIMGCAAILLGLLIVLCVSTVT